MHWTMAQLLHKTGDEDDALFNEVQARRMARHFLHELGHMGSWAVYQEDAQVITSSRRASSRVDLLLALKLRPCRGPITAAK